MAKTAVRQGLKPAAQLNFKVQRFVFALFLAQQERQERNAIGLLRRFNAGYLGEGRHQVLKGADMRGRRSVLGPPSPIGDERYPDSTFVQVPLPAPERSVAVEKLVIVPPRGKVRAIVAGEQHQGVVQLAHLLELVQQAPDLPVQQRDLGRMHTFNLRPALVRVEFGIPERAFERVRRPVGHEQEKGPVPVHSVEKFECQIRSKMVLAVVLRVIVGHEFLVSVNPQPLRGKLPATETRAPLFLHGIVETVAPGPGFHVIGVVQMPFADERRLVSGSLHHLAKGEFVPVQGDAFPPVVAEVSGIAADGHVRRAPSGQKDRSRR